MKRRSKYALKHALQLRGIFNADSPLPNYRYKDIVLSNKMTYKIKFAL